MTYNYPPPHVGNWLPFLVGLPLGGAAGYFLRRWQEANPGHVLPGIPSKMVGQWYDIEPIVGCLPPAHGEMVGCSPYTVGGPWVDLVGCEPYTVGGPWVDVVGAQGTPDYARHRTWPQTRLLIQSAIAEVSEAAARAPSAAYVWSLDPPGPSPYPGVELTGTTIVVPFSSHAQALDYLRERIQTPHVALALFDRKSPHWPNPVNWSRSNDPAYEPFVAQQISRGHSTARASGEIAALVGALIDETRELARGLANGAAGPAVGVVNATHGGWMTRSLPSLDAAVDWIQAVARDRTSFTYAAIFEKAADGSAFFQDEEFGGGHSGHR
jgi:hypothetical protein